MPDGRPALLHLFDHLAPDVIAEVDIYWAQVGGSDPKAIVAELGSRVGLLHVKDGPADVPQSPMVAVGDGVVDVPGVLAAAPGARWHIVELDRCATDMFDAVERSYDYLVGNGYSRASREPRGEPGRDRRVRRDQPHVRAHDLAARIRRARGVRRRRRRPRRGARVGVRRAARARSTTCCADPDDRRDREPHAAARALGGEPGRARRGQGDVQREAARRRVRRRAGARASWRPSAACRSVARPTRSSAPGCRPRVR